jgi:hypothetical protein
MTAPSARRWGAAATAARKESVIVKDVGRYDGNLETFGETPQGINVAHLRFVRWLVEQGRLEHLPAGPPTGELAVVGVIRPPGQVV